MLRRTLNARIGRTGLPVDYVIRLWAAAVLGAAAAWAIKLSMPAMHPVLLAGAVLAPYGAVVFAAALALRVPEASAAWRRLARIQS